MLLLAGILPSVTGVGVLTGAAPNPGFLGGNDASTQQIEAAFNTVSNNGHGSSFYEQGSPQVFSSSWIKQLDAMFGNVTPAAPVAAPIQAPAVSQPLPAVAPNNVNMIATPLIWSPVPGSATDPNAYTATTNPTAAPIGAGTPSMSAPNPNPAVTGDPTTTTASTATTGQNLASAAPGTVLGDLLASLSNAGGNSGTYNGSGGGAVSIPPSTVLPTSSGGSSVPSTSSSTAANPTSVTDMIVIGVIASLVAAALWYFFSHHDSFKGIGNSLKTLEKKV